MEHRDLILEYSRKWKSLGIDSISIKMEMECGSKKLHRQSMRITDEMRDNPELLPEGFNFLGIFLRDSGIFCLDIEGLPGSVESFYVLLKERGVEPDTFLMEKSGNGGLHAYFRMGSLPLKTEHFKLHGGIHYDILTHFRAFTTPSQLKGKKYEWIGPRFDQIVSIQDIPSFPESLYDFLDI